MARRENAAEITARIHRDTIIIDAHCDTIERAYRAGANLAHFPAAQLDFARLLAVGVKVQFFAAYIATEYKPERSLKRVLQLIDFFHQQLAQNSQYVRLVRRMMDITKAIQSGQIAALLSVEGGEPVEGDLAYLRILYRLGVRSLGLTWNQRNQLADGVGERETQGGLTLYGRAVVQEMNRLGMLIDVSHMSEAGFWDVIQETQHPVIASHANCYALVPHPRNLTDDQITALANVGGVVGITFVPEFLAEDDKAIVTRVLDHIDHVTQLVGVDHVGIGSDFDGTETTLPGLEDVTRLPQLTEGLLKRGYSGEEIQKIMGGNFLRVLKQVIG